ncbi:MAG: NAD(P)H-dependent oxidoreductase subunit E [Dehalococcoidia bacterium]|nr:NAD(P)H-dependent oxidoreductase subunit E [Dehalococcoidia bacterium]
MSSSDEALRQRIRQAIASQPQPTVTVLSSLLAVQDAVGWLPPEAIEEVARHTGATVNDVWAVASFYTNFRFTPPGIHTIEVCWGPTCHLLGAQAILRAVQEALGLPGEGDTPDKRFSLKLNTCLGACAQAPALLLDHHLYGRVTPEQARRLLQGLNHTAPHQEAP